RTLYYMLEALDPDFPELFRVVVDFEDDMDRSDDNARRFAQMAAGIVTERGLRHVDAGGIARLIDEGARLAADSTKLSLEVERLSEILIEADYWASVAGRGVVGAEDVDRAISEAIYRAGR